MRKIDDRFVTIYLGMGFPIFLVFVTGILLFSAITDRISFNELFESLQGAIPVFIAYVGAIIGFAFNPEVSNLYSLRKKHNAHSIQNIIRIYVSLFLPTVLMIFHIILTVVFVFGLISFSNYKMGTAAITWTLTGSVSFIIGKYFGESVLGNLKETD